MKEQLVTFEVAKLAKEKGFNELSDSCYNIIGVISNNINNKNQDWTDNKVYTAPTQSLLQKWLREIHKINVYCIPSDFEEGTWYNNIASHNPVFTGTYEEALEIGLQEGLQLI